MFSALVVAFGIPGPVSALDPAKRITQYSLTAWKVADGLPQATVRCVEQTPDGYLWVGTEAGLARFDGRRWDVLDRRSHPEIFENSHVYALAYVPGQGLWIATYGSGLILYDDGEMRRVGVEQGLPSGRITSLAPSSDGSLWVGTYGAGVVRLRGDEIEIWDASRGLVHPVIFDLAEDSEGTLWVATYGGGLHRLAGERFEPLGQADGLVDDHVWSVHPAADGALWVGTNGGLQRLTASGFETWTTADGLSHDRVLSVLEDGDGNIWLGTYGGGLNRIQGGDIQGGEIQTLGRLDGLSSDHVWTLFEDREGSLWLGTLGGGLVQLKDGAFTTLSVQEGLSSELPSGFAEDAEGRIWIAGRSGGLDILDPDSWGQDGAVSTLTVRDGLPSNSLWSVVFDRRGDLWVASSGRGPARRGPSGWTYWRSGEKGLADATIFALLEDLDGDMWLATNNGLNRYRAETDRFDHFTVADGLGSDQVRTLFEDRSGRLWVGTVQGLVVREDGRFRAVSMPKVAVQAMVQDADDPGIFWVATGGEGLIRLAVDAAGEVVQANGFHTGNGFFDDQIRVVVEDEQGFLWVAGSRGVVRVAKQDLAAAPEPMDRIPYVAFGERDGMKSSSVYGGQRAGFKDSDGRIWFATLNGATVVDPDRLESPAAPDVALRGVWVDGVEVGETRQFPSKSKSYRFELTAVTLSVPEKIALRYRLVGFESEWRRVDGARAAQYGLLAPGDYVFETMAGDENGRWSGSVTRFPFTVQPAFHQTGTFRLLLLLMMAVSGVSLHLLRVAHLRRRELELRERIDEALARVKSLQGMLPICASCKKIRSDEGYWEQIETYLDSHADVTFSHGICPTCADDLFPGVAAAAESGEER